MKQFAITFNRASNIVPNIAMLLACLAVGGVLAAPLGIPLVLALLALLAFASLCAARPNAAMCLAVAVFVVVPQYVLLVLPGLPVLPISLGPVLVLVTLLVVRALVSEVPLYRPQSAAVTLFYVFGVALFIAAMVGGDKDAMMLFIRGYLIPLMLFVTVLYYVPRSGQALRVMNWLLVAACIAALFAVVEFALKENYLIEKLVLATDMDPSLKASITTFYQGHDAFAEQALLYRCFSFFTNPLEYGTFMTMIFPFAFVHAATVTSVKERRRYAIAALICAVGVVVSFSRGPILALVLSSIAIAFFIPKLRRAVIIAIASALLIAAAMWPVIGERIQSRLNEVDNVTVRFKLWETGAEMFADNVVFGVGLSQYAQHEDETIRKHGIGPFYEYGGSTEKIATVDNHLIQLAAETGLVGLTTYCALLCFLFFALFRVWKHHSQSFARHTALAIAVGIANYLFNGLTITSYVLFVITMIFTFFVAVAASLDAEVVQ